MPAITLPTLPTELLNAVGWATLDHDLPSLLLANKDINATLTPQLYASITLQNAIIARKCIDVLAREPAQNYAERDLASLVRSFRVMFHHFGLEEELRTHLARSFASAFMRMCGLQHAVLDSMHYGTPTVCVALARGAARTLRTLTFRPDEEDMWADESDARVLDDFRPDFPELTAVALILCDLLPPTWYRFFRHVFASRAPHIRKLSIAALGQRSMRPLFPVPGVWSALEELSFMTERIAIPFAELPPAPNVRKLTLNIYPYEPEDVVKLVPESVPAHLFPKLEYLACPYQFLPLFLPADAKKLRPIRTIRLNRACSGPKSRRAKSFDPDKEAPDWADVRRALSCLPRSTGPVVDLAIYIDRLDVETFTDELVSYAKTLEQLVIVLYQYPGHVSQLMSFGARLFAHTPKLRSFFLSDAKATGGHFAHHDEQKLLLEEWEKNTNVLMNVAFTTKYGWKRTTNGWTLNTYEREDSGDEDE